MSRKAAAPTDVSARVEAALSGPVRRATKRKRPLPQSAIDDIQLGALHHPDLQMRRWCLFLLDHYANDQSTADSRASDAIAEAARSDGDSLVRTCAREAVEGRFVPLKKRYERSQQRHAAAHH